MSHTETLPLPSSSVEDISPQRMLLLLLLLLIVRHPCPVVTASPSTMALWRHGNRVSIINICQHLETVDGGLTVRCSGLKLKQVPLGLSNRTTRLFLNKNLLSFLPADSFYDLYLLDELDLSYNQLSSLEAGCFSGLESSLSFLDLSSNRLSMLDPSAFGGLRVRANLTNNPWHCDCRMQLSVPQLAVDSSSLAEVVCQTSDIPNRGAVGIPLVLLMEDWDLCLSVRRTTDILTLITMLLWFVMLISYLAYYIRQNKVFARQHWDYLKFLENRAPFHGFATA